MPTKIDDARLVALLLVIIGAVVIVPLFFMGFGMMGFGPMMGGTWGGHMWSDGTMPGWMVITGIVIQLLFLTLLVGGGYLIYRAITGDESGQDQALDALRFAYARGELTDEEYEQRRETLERDT
ncbi:MAG: SHOCT domain-containing protein [Halorhabdus sp.]